LGLFVTQISWYELYYDDIPFFGSILNTRGEPGDLGLFLIKRL